MKKEIKKPEYFKKEIRDSLYFYVDTNRILSGSLTDVANNILALEQQLLEIKAVASANYIRFEMETDVEYDYGNASLQVQFYGIKMETDADFLKRIERSEKMAEAQKLSAIKRKEANEKRNLTTYLKLKAKYENIDVKD